MMTGTLPRTGIPLLWPLMCELDTFPACTPGGYTVPLLELERLFETLYQGIMTACWVKRIELHSPL